MRATAAPVNTLCMLSAAGDAGRSGSVVHAGQTVQHGFMISG